MVALQPKFHKDISFHQTVARDMIDIYNVEREKLKEALSSYSVCLIMNKWTSIQNLNYVSYISFYWWFLEIYIREFLNFCQVEDPKMETIGRKVGMSLHEWFIDSMLTLTVDNTSSNSDNIRFLK